jgi:hypothetical protein
MESIEILGKFNQRFDETIVEDTLTQIDNLIEDTMTPQPLPSENTMIAQPLVK